MASESTSSIAAYVRFCAINKISLCGIDLTSKNLEDLDLAGLDLKDSVLVDVNFSRCNLEGVDFSGSNLSGAVFKGAIINGETRLQSVKFQGGEFEGLMVGKRAI